MIHKYALKLKCGSGGHLYYTGAGEALPSLDSAHLFDNAQAADHKRSDLNFMWVANAQIVMVQVTTIREIRTEVA